MSVNSGEVQTSVWELVVHMWKVSSSGKSFDFPSQSCETPLKTASSLLTLGVFRREGGSGRGKRRRRKKERERTAELAYALFLGSGCCVCRDHKTGPRWEQNLAFNRLTMEDAAILLGLPGNTNEMGLDGYFKLNWVTGSGLLEEKQLPRCLVLFSISLSKSSGRKMWDCLEVLILTEKQSLGSRVTHNSFGCLN